MTIQPWIERLPELTTGYELKNIRNKDGSGLFFKAFKALPEKGLVQKSRNCKGGKKSKQRFTAVFFVGVDGSKVSVVVWKSKSQRCFQITQNKARPSMVHYFSNNTAGMRTEIMENVLRLLD